ncbi:unnamed protein product, partial [Amoebophrya sp. A120]
FFEDLSTTVLAAASTGAEAALLLICPRKKAAHTIPELEPCSWGFYCSWCQTVSVMRERRPSFATAPLGTRVVAATLLVLTGCSVGLNLQHETRTLRQYANKKAGGSSTRTGRKVTTHATARSKREAKVLNEKTTRKKFDFLKFLRDKLGVGLFSKVNDVSAAQKRDSTTGSASFSTGEEEQEVWRQLGEIITPENYLRTPLELSTLTHAAKQRRAAAAEGSSDSTKKKAIGKCMCVGQSDYADTKHAITKPAHQDWITANNNDSIAPHWQNANGTLIGKSKWGGENSNDTIYGQLYEHKYGGGPNYGEYCFAWEDIMKQNTAGGTDHAFYGKAGINKQCNDTMRRPRWCVQDWCYLKQADPMTPDGEISCVETSPPHPQSCHANLHAKKVSHADWLVLLLGRLAVVALGFCMWRSPKVLPRPPPGEGILD